MQRRIRDSYPRVSGEVVQVEFEISGCAGWGDLSFGTWEGQDRQTSLLFFRRYACHNLA